MRPPESPNALFLYFRTLFGFYLIARKTLGSALRRELKNWRRELKNWDYDVQHVLCWCVRLIHCWLTYRSIQKGQNHRDYCSINR